MRHPIGSVLAAVEGVSAGERRDLARKDKRIDARKRLELAAGKFKAWTRGCLVGKLAADAGAERDPRAVLEARIRREVERRRRQGVGARGEGSCASVFRCLLPFF